MNRQNQIDERHAAVLLGLTIAELRRFSRLAGLGHMDERESNERMIFTYEELHRVCLRAPRASV